MWSIIWGLILILAAASGGYVLRGTEGETGQALLGIAGLALLAYGIYRVASPRVLCPTCGESLRKARFDEHLKERHGLSAPAGSAEEWWSGVFGPPSADAGKFGGRMAGVTLECGHRYQVEVSQTPAGGIERQCPTCGKGSRVTRVATPTY